MVNRPKRIMIVGNNAITCTARAELFNEAGYTVTVANTATEAFCQLESEHTIDIALIETGFEGKPEEIDGIDLARVLQEEHAVAVVLVSTSVSLDLLPRLSLVDSYGIIDQHASELSFLASIEIAFKRRKAERRAREECLRKLLAAIPDIISINNPESIYAL